jgi:hypothetical protein
MSQRLISRNSDLKRLRDEGYNVDVTKSGYLLLKDIPYVTQSKDVKIGILVSKLLLSGDVTQRPDDHTVFFIGECPCDKDGKRFSMVINNDHKVLSDGIEVDHQFSSKPGCGYYSNYYQKMTTYLNILYSHAHAINNDATPYTHPLIKGEDDNTTFEYVDTASSRAEIVAASEKLSGLKIAIVGLGGTGAYVLDLLAKTPVSQIHLYDGDTFFQHNAFRAPGAASSSDLEGHFKKVDYYTRIYSKMKKGLFPHPDYISESNVTNLDSVDYVFLCMDGGPEKRMIMDHLQEKGIRFIDCGIGLYVNENCIGGQVRVTTSTAEKKDHLWKYICNVDVDGDEYETNIQIADLNALAAVLAIIKWKKLVGFYSDFQQEHHTVYIVDGNELSNEEFP